MKNILLKQINLWETNGTEGDRKKDLQETGDSLRRIRGLDARDVCIIYCLILILIIFVFVFQKHI